MMQAVKDLQPGSEEAEAAMWDAYNYMSLCPDVDRMRKLLVRYDLFKQVCDCTKGMWSDFHWEFRWFIFTTAH